MNVFLTALLLISHPLMAAEEKTAARPNIILILADDMGWKDTGFNGDGFFETPHIDQLAKEGMVFTSGYAAAGNCAPSRACLISGNYTPRHEVYAVGSTQRGLKTAQRLMPIRNKSGLAEANITVADALKNAGYATGIFGKWHLDGKDGAAPEVQGFDTVFKSGHSLNSKEPEDPKAIFSLTQAAGEFITKHKDGPFFLYLPHYGIHAKLQSRASSLAKFEKKAADKQDPDPLYAACTYDLDAGVGILMDKLKELDLEKNTLVVFTSDNGGALGSSQEPLRGNKGSYYEGGIREPFIVRWPGLTQPGSTCDVPVINVDLFPTFLVAAGAAVPEGKTLDGTSLLPLFRKENVLNERAVFWHFPGYLDQAVVRGRELDVRTNFRSRPVTVIRKGDWKLHLYHEEWQLDGGREKLATNHAVELYDLKQDIGERNDLAVTNLAKRDELLDELLLWTREKDAKMASQPNSTYDPAAVKSAGKKGEKRGKKSDSEGGE